MPAVFLERSRKFAAALFSRSQANVLENFVYALFNSSVGWVAHSAAGENKDWICGVLEAS